MLFPPAKRGGYADSAATLEAQVLAAIRAGDAIMVKGSFGSKMKTLPEKRFPCKAALAVKALRALQQAALNMSSPLEFAMLVVL